ncbi:DUF5994 family protein [Streptomyces sp. 7N604]|uniref:DUF5994 family protein n=1 Tax=Streptomyces sp. 7N604 TaxID=3457415 RepID=UPI003FD13062
MRLAPRGSLPRRIDGAWWPHTHDLVAELPLLIAALPRTWGQIARVTVSGAMWCSSPRRMLVANHVVRLGRSTTHHDPPTICLLAPGQGRWDLLVVPPETTETEAELLMAAAAAPASV